MLKIKMNDLTKRDAKKEGYILEHEMNEIDNRLIFPVYAVNGFVEAIELIEEDDYYVLKPCVFNEGEDVSILDYDDMEDFKDAIDTINTFMEFNIENIIEIEVDSLKEFIVEFLKNTAIYVNEVKESSVVVDFINTIDLKFNIVVLDYQICFDMQLVNNDTNIVLADNLISFSINTMIEQDELECFMESLDNDEFKAHILNSI